MTTTYELDAMDRGQIQAAILCVRESQRYKVGSERNRTAILLNRIWRTLSGVSGADLKALGTEGLIELGEGLISGAIPVEWAESFVAGSAG